MLRGGDVYLRDVLTDAGMRSPSRSSAVDSALTSTRARVASLVSARRTKNALSADELSALRDEWTSMSHSLRTLLGPDVNRYLAPPHPSPNEAHHHRAMEKHP
jgi:hypothetical protein